MKTDFQAQYQQKLTTADEAVKVVKSGDWVYFCWCVSTPVALDQALARRSEELTDVKVSCFNGVFPYSSGIVEYRTEKLRVNHCDFGLK